ncbi:unnamed protein product [Chrysoparadoxa australica]
MSTMVAHSPDPHLKWLLSSVAEASAKVTPTFGARAFSAEYSVTAAGMDPITYRDVRGMGTLQMRRVMRVLGLNTVGMRPVLQERLAEALKEGWVNDRIADTHRGAMGYNRADRSEDAMQQPHAQQATKKRARKASTSSSAGTSELQLKPKPAPPVPPAPAPAKEISTPAPSKAPRPASKLARPGSRSRLSNANNANAPTASKRPQSGTYRTPRRPTHMLTKSKSEAAHQSTGTVARKKAMAPNPASQSPRDQFAKTASDTVLLSPIKSPRDKSKAVLEGNPMSPLRMAADMAMAMTVKRTLGKTQLTDDSNSARTLAGALEEAITSPKSFSKAQDKAFGQSAAKPIKASSLKSQAPSSLNLTSADPQPSSNSPAASASVTPPISLNASSYVTPPVTRSTTASGYSTPPSQSPRSAPPRTAAKGTTSATPKHLVHFAPPEISKPATVGTATVDDSSPVAAAASALKAAGAVKSSSAGSDRAAALEAKKSQLRSEYAAKRAAALKSNSAASLSPIASASPATATKQVAETDSNSQSAEKQEKEEAGEERESYDNYKVHEDAAPATPAKEKPAKAPVPATPAGGRAGMPDWARGANLGKLLDAQFSGPTKMDPDEIFPEFHSCDLEKIFPDSRRAKKKRTSTGNWVNDNLTTAEREAYRKAMGFVAG